VKKILENFIFTIEIILFCIAATADRVDQNDIMHFFHPLSVKHQLLLVRLSGKNIFGMVCSVADRILIHPWLVAGDLKKRLARDDLLMGQNKIM
jgi:hypothetical protein